MSIYIRILNTFYISDTQMQERVMFMSEIWKPWPKDNSIEVSNKGNVRHASTTVVLNNESGSRKVIDAKIIKQHLYGSYMFVNFHSKSWLVGRLVAETFLDNPDKLDVIVYLDDDSTNNSSDNLAWASRAESMKRSRSSEKFKNSRGKSVPVYCRELGRRYESCKECLAVIEQLPDSPKINYDTLMRKLRGTGEAEVSGYHFTKIQL